MRKEPLLHPKRYFYLLRMEYKNRATLSEYGRCYVKNVKQQLRVFSRNVEKGNPLYRTINKSF
jgi:hypothetical protein